MRPSPAIATRQTPRVNQLPHKEIKDGMFQIDYILVIELE
jgi:hypothetical protein